MKKLTLTFIALTIAVSSLFAQHGVKINVLGLTVKDFGLGYEFIINDEISAALFINAVTGTPYYNYELITPDENYSALKISPEFRYYLGSNFGADRLFLSGYLRYNSEKFSDITLHYYDNALGQSNDIIYDFSNTSLVLGAGAGNKWLFNSSLYVEAFFGIGIKAINNPSFSDIRAEEEMYEEHPKLTNYYYTNMFDYRLQISLGYRFGGY